ncbi:MAG: response regulator transcription factor [Ichthyobacteriaceae bacterium]|nr:response regulator transcription factor [Ichthyobacteriaceae bacterium]
MLNCITVDDSNIQLKVISELVRQHPSLKLVGSFTNAIEAREGLKNLEVDLIFLDIEMPVVSGFDFLETFKDIPQVIIVTSKKEYAFEAFKYDVTGFLNKPIDKDSFQKAIDRSLLFHENVFNKEEDTTEDETIFVKSNLVNKKVFLKDIKWIEAVGDYVKVVTNSENHIVLSTMKAFVAKLPEERFMRIHKSYIVNLERVKRFNSKTVDIEDHKLPLSRTKKIKLFDMLNAN